MSWPNNIMNKKRRVKCDIFTTVCICITIFVLLLIGSNIVIITFRGMTQITKIVKDQETQFAVALSVKSACISSILCFALSVPTAYALTKVKFFLREVIEVILELTMSLPYIVIGLSLLLIFSSDLGKKLKELGFFVVFQANGIILAQLIVNLPFAIKLVVMAFKDVDEKLEKVAGLLGATQCRIFFTILIPLCKNAIISAFILVWSRALGEFGATLMLVGVTRMKTETLPGNIFLNVSVNNIDGALASGFILLLISALSLGISNWLCRANRKSRHYET